MVSHLYVPLKILSLAWMPPRGEEVKGMRLSWPGTSVAGMVKLETP